MGSKRNRNWKNDLHNMLRPVEDFNWADDILQRSMECPTCPTSVLHIGGTDERSGMRVYAVDADNQPVATHQATEAVKCVMVCPRCAKQAFQQGGRIRTMGIRIWLDALGIDYDIQDEEEIETDDGESLTADEFVDELVLGKFETWLGTRSKDRVQCGYCDEEQSAAGNTAVPRMSVFVILDDEGRVERACLLCAKCVEKAKALGLSGVSLDRFLQEIGGYEFELREARQRDEDPPPRPKLQQDEPKARPVAKDEPKPKATAKPQVDEEAQQAWIDSLVKRPVEDLLDLNVQQMTACCGHDCQVIQEPAGDQQHQAMGVYVWFNDQWHMTHAALLCQSCIGEGRKLELKFMMLKTFMEKLERIRPVLQKRLRRRARQAFIDGLDKRPISSWVELTMETEITCQCGKKQLAGGDDESSEPMLVCTREGDDYSIIEAALICADCCDEAKRFELSGITLAAFLDELHKVRQIREQQRAREEQARQRGEQRQRQQRATAEFLETIERERLSLQTWFGIDPDDEQRCAHCGEEHQVGGETPMCFYLWFEDQGRYLSHAAAICSSCWAKVQGLKAMGFQKFIEHVERQQAYEQKQERLASEAVRFVQSLRPAGQFVARETEVVCGCGCGEKGQAVNFYLVLLGEEDDERREWAVVHKSHDRDLFRDRPCKDGVNIASKYDTKDEGPNVGLQRAQQAIAHAAGELQPQRRENGVMHTRAEGGNVNLGESSAAKREQHGRREFDRTVSAMEDELAAEELAARNAGLTSLATEPKLGGKAANTSAPASAKDLQRLVAGMPGQMKPKSQKDGGKKKGKSGNDDNGKKKGKAAKKKARKAAGC